MLLSSHLNWLVGSIQYRWVVSFIYLKNIFWISPLCQVYYLFSTFMTLSYISFSPSTMAVICQTLLPVFLPLLDLKMFEFIGIIADTLSLVILFSPVDLHLSLCQQSSNLYLWNHTANLLHNIFTWMAHRPLKLNRLKSEILTIPVPWLHHKFHSDGDTRKPEIIIPPCLYKQEVLCILPTQTSFLHPDPPSLQLSPYPSYFSLSPGLEEVSHFHFAYVTHLFFVNIKFIAGFFLNVKIMA